MAEVIVVEVVLRMDDNLHQFVEVKLLLPRLA